jgi:hypothetical protein
MTGRLSDAELPQPRLYRDFLAGLCDGDDHPRRRPVRSAATTHLRTPSKTATLRFASKVVAHETDRNSKARKVGGAGHPARLWCGAPLGELFVRVDEATAAATLQAAWDAGVWYYDTAPYYGRGLSEIRFGRFLTPGPGLNSSCRARSAAGSFRPPSLTNSKPVRPGRGVCDSTTCMTIAMTASCALMSNRRCGWA